jgi:pimeloyl-ACP methyl ester carboxylesterase
MKLLSLLGRNLAMLEERIFEVETDNHRLRIKSIAPAGGSPADGPTLVLLHEGLGSIGQWRDFPEALVRATGLAALVYDRYGFGGSTPLRKARDGVHLQREDTSCLTAVLESCAVRAPILIGHSDGGTIALLYAARFPAKPRGVIVEAAHVFVEEATRTGIREARRAYESDGLRERLARYHGDKTDEMFGRWYDDWLSPEHQNWNVEASLTAIRCPVLVIQGEDDEYGTRDQVESICSRVSGRAESVVIAGCGHNPHLQARQRVLREMARFIAGLQ